MSTSPAPGPASPEPGYHPTFVHARREAWIIAGLWFACLLWAVPYCYLNGYPEPGQEGTISTVWGIPSWVFFGILVPWLLADVFTTWFCFCYMKDDDLGEEEEPQQHEEQDGAAEEDAS